MDQFFFVYDKRKKGNHRGNRASCAVSSVTKERNIHWLPKRREHLKTSLFTTYVASQSGKRRV